MWINDVSRRSLNPITPFEQLPKLEKKKRDNQTLHWTGATTVLVIRTLVVGPGQ